MLECCCRRWCEWWWEGGGGGQALECAPRRAGALRAYGHLLRDAFADAAAALALYRRAAAAEPADADSQHAVGGALQLAGDAGGAAAAYEAGLRADPAHAGCLNNLAVLRYDQARAALSRIMRVWLLRLVFNAPLPPRLVVAQDSLCGCCGRVYG
jgi:tetratricopeptide (TPR) repeat protein